MAGAGGAAIVDALLGGEVSPIAPIVVFLMISVILLVRDHRARTI